MRILVAVAIASASIAQADDKPDDGLDSAHSEIGIGAFATIANKGMSTAAGIRFLGSRMWSRIGLRGEYGIMGAGFDDVQRYGYIHRIAGTFRYRIPWYREHGTRVETHVDFGGGRQAIRWDDRTDWRNDVMFGAGVRLDCLRNTGGWIGTGYMAWGVGFAVMIAPSVRPQTIERGVTIDDDNNDYDVGIMFTNEVVF
jgi:hypothetical protein